MKKKKFNPIREIVADMHVDGVRFNEQVLAALKAQELNRTTLLRGTAEIKS
ncbi:MAG: hypothetical protein KJO39_11640 [Bacteroidia bacterium]|nr:hypothetical protein [Bacteroidia bacterium]NNF31734.1 hypothetical protein [Flavobacteriaceae bacterium]NNJ81105.1 hypothetical protein [Flavobacteriaceae bacterium]NNK55248.1 hypothetical protein [Flavobacteriaceae bacterium]NNM10243.1 hypothetical protein [Flavobacteriaceae bacterium]